METMYTIFADFNNVDSKARIRLDTQGTFEDLKRLGIELKPGLTVMLDDREEITIQGIVEFSEDEKIWVAKIDWLKLGIDMDALKAKWDKRNSS